MCVISPDWFQAVGQWYERFDQTSDDEVLRLLDESKGVDLVLKAGDVSVHHPSLIHGSNANTSAKRRCGLTIRYIPTSTRIRTKENERWASAFLLRGEAVPGVNEYNPLPRYVEGQHMPFRGCEAWKG